MTGHAAAVLVAAGRARRMGSSRNKVYLPLAGRPVLAHALVPFERHPQVKELVVVVAPGEAERCQREVLDRFPFRTPLRLALGGSTRQASVLNGLEALSGEHPLVLVHDAARPLVSPALIGCVLEAARRHGAAVPGLPVSDSLKRVGADQRVIASPAREGLYRAQTPQGFRLERLRGALARAQAEGQTFSDDAAAVARYSDGPIVLVPGEPFNLKLTVPEDLELAACLMRLRS